MGDKTRAISEASKNLAYTIDQINEGVIEMDRVAQENAANSEEFAGASETLSLQAEYLVKYIKELTALVGKDFSHIQKH